jgi:uncharacterized membrane protein YcaP (DUF421 family)
VLLALMNRHIEPLLSVVVFVVLVAVVVVVVVVVAHNNYFEPVEKNKPMVIMDNCIIVDDTYMVGKS